MLIQQTSDIKPSEITSKADYLSRRKFISLTSSKVLSLYILHASLVKSGDVMAAEKIENFIKNTDSPNTRLLLAIIILLNLVWTKKTRRPIRVIFSLHPGR